MFLKVLQNQKIERLNVFLDDLILGKMLQVTAFGVVAFN